MIIIVTQLKWLCIMLYFFQYLFVLQERQPQVSSRKQGHKEVWLGINNDCNTYSRFFTCTANRAVVTHSFFHIIVSSFLSFSFFELTGVCFLTRFHIILLLHWSATSLCVWWIFFARHLFIVFTASRLVLSSF